MFIIIVVLVIVGIILLNWLKPFLEYKKIGSYAEYKPVSKTLNDKEIEYSWYQINGFKNINNEAIEYLYQVSKRCTKNDLKWLNQCIEFLEAGLIEAGESDATKLSLPDPIGSANLLEILKVIKKSRKPLSEHYKKIGCSTCGEAVVLHTWFELRVQQIKNGEAIKPGDLDYVIDAVKEVKSSMEKHQ